MRQGALLAASMVLMQNSEHADDSKQAEHRKRLAKVVGDKHEEVTRTRTPTPTLTLTRTRTLTLTRTRTPNPTPTLTLTLQVMAKFGAILATGLLDAGGRNVTISLMSKSGQKQMGGIVGMAVFTHFW